MFDGYQFSNEVLDKDDDDDDGCGGRLKYVEIRLQNCLTSY